MKSIFSLCLTMVLSLAVCQAQKHKVEKMDESEKGEKMIAALDVN